MDWGSVPCWILARTLSRFLVRWTLQHGSLFYFFKECSWDSNRRICSQVEVTEFYNLILEVTSITSTDIHIQRGGITLNQEAEITYHSVVVPELAHLSLCSQEMLVERTSAVTRRHLPEALLSRLFSLDMTLPPELPPIFFLGVIWN